MNHNKKNIIFIAASTSGGGAERMQINIMNSLNEVKYNIYFVNTSSEPKPSTLNSNIFYTCIGKKHAKNSFWILAKSIKVIKPEYLFTTSTVVAYMLVLIRALYNIKAKLFIRIAVPPSESQLKNFKSQILKKINSIALKKADLIIAQTDYSKKDINKHYQVALDKIKVIRNITDKKMLDTEGDRFIPEEFDKTGYNIVASGALYSVKGFDLLVDAMVNVVKQFSNVKLFILGEVRYELDYKENLQKQIKANKLSDHVFLLGHKNNPYPYYKHADLFVMSSRMEGFPNVVLEALHYGIPVITTDCVDFKGVINEGVNGYIVNKNSADTLSEGIVRGISTLKKPVISEIESFNYENIFT